MKLRLLFVTSLVCACSEPGAGNDVAPIQTNWLDVLVVVDSSASMAQEQASLRDQFDRIIGQLASRPDGLPDLHIGVITSDLGSAYAIQACLPGGDGGALTAEPRVLGCTPPRDRYLADEIAADGSRRRNYDGELAEAFACIAPVGDQGCGFEQPLAAVERALADPDGVNVGFRRPGARLAIVFLSDEDDCSATDTGLFDPERTDLGELSSFRCTRHGLVCDGGAVGDDPGRYQACQPADDSAFLVSPAAVAACVSDLVGGADRVMVSVIAGERGPLVVEDDVLGPRVAPSCASDAGEAIGAYRLGAFADAFEQRLFASICEPDLGGALAATGAMLRDGMSSGD